jgi:hypothetical protein
MFKSSFSPETYSSKDFERVVQTVLPPLTEASETVKMLATHFSDANKVNEAVDDLRKTKTLLKSHAESQK